MAGQRIFYYKIGLLIELVFMEPIMEIFKLSGSQKCSQTNFQICRILLVILTILCDVTMVYYGEFYHTNLTHHRSFYVCQQNNLMANWQTGVPIVASMFALIVICIVFAYKTYKLITSTPLQIMKQHTLRQVQQLIEVNIKHTLLACSLLFWCILVMNMDSTLLTILPLMDLGTGLSVYMVFTFGDTKYFFLFGRVHQYLINKWLSRYPSIPEKKRKRSKARDKSD
eukprot:1005156_1